MVIDGPSNSSSVISGFTSGDQIDFEDLNFSAGVATIFDGIDNVLQVIGSGTTYRIQFDPSQNFSGGFQVASDGADGTVVTLVPHVVTGYTTTASGGTAISPYQGVCYIDDIFPDQPNRTISRATGFIIGPHTILTNAHVIKDTSGIAGAIEIVPGSANGRSSPSYIATSVEINQAYSPGQLVPTQSNEQYDFAVINVSADLSAYGIFGLQSAYSSGTLNLTGYPAYPYGISSKGPSAKSQYNDIGSATADRNYGVLDYGPINPIVSYQGNSGGPLWIYGSSGATAVGIAATTYYGVQITSADLQLINNWTANSLISTSISSNSIIVSGGQAAFNISVQNAGSVTIASGGIVTGASIGSGGTEIISGGTDLAGIVNDAGLQALGSGSFVSGTVLNDPGVQSVGFGATAVGVIVRGGIEIIASGGTASNTTVSSGGTLEVLSGGMATAWHLLSGATLVVEAPISGFTVGKGVTLVVSGTTGSKTTVLAGRTLELLGGATLSSNTVNAGGVLEIGSGAALSSYSVSRGIRLAAMSDGVVSSASVAGSGTLLVLPGGTAASATVSGGGLEAVSAGGAGSATVLKGGTIELFGSNSARYDLSAGANVLVGSGYVFSGTVSSGIAKVLSGGTDMGTTVSRGGMLIAASGGTLVGPMISAGGTAIVSSGGAVELLGGDTTSGLALLSLGTMEVGSGATLGSFIVSKGVTIEVLSGGLATTTVSVGNGGTLELLGGSTASYTLLSGATLGIASGYGLSGQTVSRGVVLKVLAGGAASATTVSSGGTELVASGGSDLGVNIDAKGLVRVMSGGFESGASIASGGVLIVSSGGAATGVNVASGGTQTISAGGTSTDLAVLGTALDAGTVILSDLALIGSSAVLETLSGGTAILSGSVTNSGTLFASGAHSLIDIVSGATVAGGGNAKIANGVVDIKGGGDNQNVVFQSGGTGGLVLADTLGNTSAFAGQVSGFGQNVHQFIDLGAVASGGSGVVSASYSSSTASSGVLTVTSGGSANVVAVIDFSGHYVTSNFHITSGASGSAEIFDPPVAALPPTVVSADLALFVNYLAASFPTMAHHGGFITDLLQPASEPLQLTRPGQ